MNVIEKAQTAAETAVLFAGAGSPLLTKKPNKAAEHRAAAERLLMCLEYVTVDGEPLRGTNMNHEISDGFGDTEDKIEQAKN